MTMGFALDIVVAVLLVVTVFYCWRLNQRLSTLRQGREELANLVTTLTQATQRAENSIHVLKAAAQEASATLDAKVKTAESLRDELSLITETGNNLADRLENRLTGTKAESDAAPKLEEVRTGRTPKGKEPDAAAREEILKVLRQAR